MTQLDETTRYARQLHDELGLPRSNLERWVHDQRADERREVDQAASEWQEAQRRYVEWRMEIEKRGG